MHVYLNKNIFIHEEVSTKLFPHFDALIVFYSRFYYVEKPNG